MSERGPQPGDAAPDFTLPGSRGAERRDFTLSEYRGRKVALAFYPGDATPGCSIQLKSYRDDFEEFERAGAVVLAVSPQDVDSKERWCEREHFEFPLLADTEKSVIARVRRDLADHRGEAIDLPHRLGRRGSLALLGRGAGHLQATGRARRAARVVRVS